ncbi:MAG TPA: hypothetical protein VGO55_10590 [Allosphingosinicella sp.]|nr:hypothetical protein [Allosphingosinicella sp.]
MFQRAHGVLPLEIDRGEHSGELRAFGRGSDPGGLQYGWIGALEKRKRRGRLDESRGGHDADRSGFCETRRGVADIDQRLAHRRQCPGVEGDRNFVVILNLALRIHAVDSADPGHPRHLRRAKRTHARRTENRDGSRDRVTYFGRADRQGPFEDAIDDYDQ